jgi:chromosome segregation protein
MAYIKRMVIQGFKSFAKKTEIEFNQGINVVIGPNGSGKSNVSDALCFALGRLSIKSMRAAKARNLIFMGSKLMKPAKEAFVEIVFDNPNNEFGIDRKEVSLARIVRTNGQSIYKINGETKTRGEVVEILAHAGIDPHGFNIILQGQIQSIVRMHSEERRKILEEVAGISIYETRKEKSLKELDKTESKLKEITTILRERTAYLKNLEKEKAQAERYKRIETTINRAKFSILNKKLENKKKELESINKNILKKEEEKAEIKKKVLEKEEESETLSAKSEGINKSIQKSSGVEQETLRNDIANLKAEIEGLKVRKENQENRKEETEHRIEELKNSIPEYEKEIKELKEESPEVAKKAGMLEAKKKELEILEDKRKKAYTLKSNLANFRERLREKERLMERSKTESDKLLSEIENLSGDLSWDSKEKALEELSKSKKDLEKLEEEEDSLVEEMHLLEKKIAVSESEIKRNEEIKRKVMNLQVKTCPLCQSEMTKEHVDHVFEDCNSVIEKEEDLLKSNKKGLEESQEEIEKIRKGIKKVKEKVLELDEELKIQDSLENKKRYLSSFVNQEKELKSQIVDLERKIDELEEENQDLRLIEEKYENKVLEIEEISSRSLEDVDTSLLYKQRELENTKNIIKRSEEDLEEIQGVIENLAEGLKDKEERLKLGLEKEEELNHKFKKMFEERDSLQKKIQEVNLEINQLQGEIRQIEEQVGYLRIGKAKLDAESESIGMELSEFSNMEVLQGSLQVLEDKLQKAQMEIQQIGSVNMKALEAYERVKGQYEQVYDKVQIIEKEKEEILKIIEEIDKKKKRTFMKTFKAINELFTENFSKLYSKGKAYLEIENKEDIFSGGVSIVVKLAKGKYFDVTSLSGGEQTLVALSLLFAIQEHSPYHFYIFDEIDAALDKRNSERLAGLLKQYMKSGQYIVVTHNDAIILDANVLYGVSMQDSVSKILSLKVDD